MSLLSTLRNVITTLQGGDRKDLPARERMSVPLGIRRLEERRVLNADLAAALAPPDLGTVSAVDAAPEHAAGQSQTAGAEILFIDSGVENWHELAIGVREGVEVVLLSSDSDGLTQIAHHLEGRTDLSAIHIVSHGDSGTLLLGNSAITGETLDRYAAELATIAGSLSANGDLLLYGCEVGEGVRGAAFLQSLSQITEADIAASTNLTGAQFLGGDWTLESEIGRIETGIAFSQQAQQSYAATLGTIAIDTSVAGTTTIELDDLQGNVTVTASGAQTRIQSAADGIDEVFANPTGVLRINGTNTNGQSLFINGMGTAAKGALDINWASGEVVLAMSLTLGNGANDGNLTITAGTIRLNNATLSTAGGTAAGDITLTGNVVLGANVTVTATNAGGSGEVNVTGSVNSDPTARSLTINSGTESISLGSVGTTSALSALTLTGAASSTSEISIGDIGTAAAVGVTGAVAINADGTAANDAAGGNLAGNVSLDRVRIGGALTVDTDAANGDGVLTISGRITTPGAVTLRAGSADLFLNDLTNDFAGNLVIQSANQVTVRHAGGLSVTTLVTAGLADFEVTGVISLAAVTPGALTVEANTITLGGNITTAAGGVLLDGDILLNAAVTVTAGGPVMFDGPIDSQGSARNLTINAGTQSITLGNVGTTLALGTLTLTGAADAGSTITVGDIGSAAAGAATVTINSDGTTAGAGNTEAGGGANAGNVNLGRVWITGVLTVDTDSNGADGLLTANQQITATIVNVRTGSANLSLGNTANNFTTLNIQSAVDSTVNHAGGLTVGTLTTTGTAEFGSAGQVDFTTVTVGTFDVEAATIRLAGVVTTSAGGVLLTGNVILGNAVTINTAGNGAVTVTGNIDSETATARALTITSGTEAITLSGNIGTSFALSTLTLTGAATSGVFITVGNIGTAGVAGVAGAVLINSDNTAATGVDAGQAADAGNVSLTGRVNVGTTLTIDTRGGANHGTLTAAGQISATTATFDVGTSSFNLSNPANDFGTLSILSAGTATVNHAGGITLGTITNIAALDVTAGGGAGSILLATAITTGIGSVTLHGSILLNAATVTITAAGPVTFDGPVNSSVSTRNLTINSGTQSITLGEVGTTMALGTLTLTGAADAGSTITVGDIGTTAAVGAATVTINSDGTAADDAAGGADAGDVQLNGLVRISGVLTIDTDSLNNNDGKLTIVGRISASTVTLRTGSEDITLTSSDSDYATLNIQSAAVATVNHNAGLLTVGTLATTGMASFTSSGQVNFTTVTTGALAVTAPTIRLAGVVTTSAGGVLLTGNVILGNAVTINTAGNGAVTVTGDTSSETATARALTITSGTESITLGSVGTGNALSTLLLTGAASSTASITVGDIGTAATVGAATVTINSDNTATNDAAGGTDAGDVQLNGLVRISGVLTIDTDSLNDNDGELTIVGRISASTVTLRTGEEDITLTSGDSDYGTLNIQSAANATVNHNAGPLTVSTLVTSGNAEFFVGGNIAFTGGGSTAGLTVDAGGNMTTGTTAIITTGLVDLDIDGTLTLGGRLGSSTSDMTVKVAAAVDPAILRTGSGTFVANNLRLEATSGNIGTSATPVLVEVAGTLGLVATGSDIFISSPTALVIDEIVTVDNQTDIVSIATTNNALLTLNGAVGYVGLEGANGDQMILRGDGGLIIQNEEISALSFEIDTTGDLVTLDANLTAVAGIEIDTLGGGLVNAATATLTFATFLDVDLGAGNGNFEGVLTGAGGLIKAGAGTLTLSNTGNAYAGATTINAGTLQLGNSNVISNTSAVSLVAGATLDLNGQSETIGSLAGTGGLVTNSAAATAATLTTGGNDASTTYSGTVTNGNGTVSLTKAGDGIFTLAGAAANTFTGTTTVAGGVLLLQKTAGVAAVSSTTVNVTNNGILRLAANNQIVDGATIDLSVNGIFDLSGRLETIAGLSGTGTVTNDSGSAVTLTINDGGNSNTFGGTILNGGGMTVTKTGAGSLTLGNAGNTFSTLNIQAGSDVSVAHAGGLTVGTAANTFNTTGLVTLDVIGTVTLGAAANVGSLDVDAATINAGANITTTNGGVTLSGSVLLTPATVIIATGDTGGVTVNGSVNGATAGRSLTINAGTQAISLEDVGTSTALVNLTLTGVVTMGGAIVSTGTATFNVGAANDLTLTNAANDFNAIVITSANNVSLRDANDFVLGSTTATGDLTLDVAGTFSATQSAAMNVGGDLELIGAGTVVLSQNNVVGGDALVQSGTLQLNTAGSLANTQNVFLAAGSRLDVRANKTLASVTGQGTVSKGTAGLATLTINDGGTPTQFDGVIENGLGTLAFTKLGSGTLTLTNDHTYTGATTVSDGTLLIDSTASLTGTATTVNGTGLLEVEGQVTGNVTIAGTGWVHVAAGGGIVGSVAVNSAGTLDVDGTVIGNVTVGSNGTLQGTDGVIQGTVDINNGGTLSPGDSPGILHFDNLALNNGSTFTVELLDNDNSNPLATSGPTPEAGRGAVAGIDYDQVQVIGTVTIGAGVTLNLQDLGSTDINPYDVYVLISNDGVDAVVGQFAGIGNGGYVTAGGMEFRLYYDGGDGNDVVLIRLPSALPNVFVSNTFSGPAGTVIADIDWIQAGNQPGVMGIDAFTTIPAALTAVDAGGTIHVDDGVYYFTGTLQINKSVTIEGEGIDQTDPSQRTEIRKAGAPTGNADEAIEITADNVTLRNVQLGWQTWTTTDYQGYVVYTTADYTTIDHVLFAEGYRSAVVFVGANYLTVQDSIFEGNWGRAAIRDSDSGSGEHFLITRNEFREDHYRHGPIAIGPQGTFGTPNNDPFSGEISFNYFASGLDVDFQEGGDQNYVVTITNRGMTADGLRIIHNTFDWDDSSETNSVGNYARPVGVYFDPSLTVPANSVIIQDNIFNGFVYMGPQVDDGPLWVEDGRVVGNGALELDGDGDFGVFQFPNQPQYDLGQSGSMSVWVKTDVDGKRHMIGGGAVEFQIRHSNDPYFYPGNRTDSTLIWSSDTILPGDGWTHLTFTWEDGGAGNQIGRIYIDGQEVNYRATYDPNVSNNWTTFVDMVNNLTFIGRDPGNPGARDFDGMIDDLAFYNAALTAGEVQSLFVDHQGNATALGAASLVAHWAFEETTGNIATDSVNGVQMLLVTNGVLPYGPTHVESGGVFGDALSFDGADDFATWRDPSFDVGEQGTLNFWVWMDNTGKRNQFFEGPGDGGLEMQYRTNSGGQVYGRTSESGDYVIRSGGDGALLNGAWHNIQYTWDFTTGEMRIYIDGAESSYLAGSTPTDLSWSTVVDTVNGLMYMGRDPGDATRNFDGMMDDVAWYNDVLSTAELTAIRTSGVSAHANLVAHWSFEDSTYNSVAGTFSGDSGTAITLYLQQLPPTPLIQGYSVVAPLAAVIDNNVMFANEDYYANNTGEYADSNHSQAAIDANNITGETANPFFHGDDPNLPPHPGIPLSDFYALRYGSSAAYQSTEYQGDIATLIPHIGAYQDVPVQYGTEDILVVGTDEDDLLVVTFTGQNTGYFVLTTDVGGANELVGNVINFDAGTLSITFNSFGGDDVLVIIQPDGAVIGLFNGLHFNAGTQNSDGNAAVTNAPETLGDTLMLLAANDPKTVDSIEYSFEDSSNPAQGNDGSIILTDLSITLGPTGFENTTTISYAGVEPIIDELSGSQRTFNFNSTAAAEAITLTNSSDSVAFNDTYVSSTQDFGLQNHVVSNFGAPVYFHNPTTRLTLNAGQGDHMITVASLAAGFAADVEIFGDDGADLVEFTQDTSAGGILVDAEQVIVRSNVAVSTTNSDPDGGLTFTNTTTITMEAGSSISTGTGNVAMDATGDITMDSGSNITAGTGTVTLISSSGDIHVSQIFSETQVSLEATLGAITDNLATEDENIVADTVILNAATGIGSDNGLLGDDDDLDIDAGTLTAVNSTSGNIQIREVNDVALVTVSNAGRPVVIDAGGRITDADDADDTVPNIIASSLAIRAGTGIGDVASDGRDIDIEADTLSASTGTGDIFLSDVTGGLEIALNIGGQSGVTANGGTGDIHIRKEGAASDLVVNAAVQNLGTGRITLEALGNTNADNLIVNQPILSTTGNITLRADNDVTLNVNGDVTSTSGNVTITADRNNNNAGALFMANGALVDAGSGRIDLDAAGNITLGGLLTTNDTAAAVTIDSRLGGVIDGGDAHVDIVANSANAVVTINAATGIGVTAGAGADPRLETTIANLVAHVTGSGGINLLETNGIQLQDVDTANGTITVETTNGNITATDVESLNDNDTNDIRLTANGSILVTLIKAGSQNDVFLTATNTIVNTDAATDASVQADDLILNVANAAGSGDGIAVSLKTQINDLSAIVTGGSQGDLEIFEVDDINLATSDAASDAEILSTTNGEIRVTAGGSIVVYDTAAGNEGGGLNGDPEISAQGGNGRIALTAGADFTLQDNAQIEASQFTDGAVKIVAGANVEFGQNVQINTGSGVGIARLIAPRPEMSTPPSGSGTAFYDASSILAPTITSIGGGNYQAKLTFHIGAAGEQGLVIHIDWSDFSEPGSERFQEFIGLTGDTVFSTTHNYTETDLLNAFFNGRTSAADPMTVIFSVSFHPSIVIIGDTVTPPGGGTPNDVNGNLLSSTDNPLTGDNPNPDFPTGTPFENGFARFTLPSLDAMPPIIITPPSFTTFETPTVADVVEQIVTTPIITTDNGASVASFAVGRDEYLELRVLSPDPEAAPLAVRRLPDEFLAGNEGASFTELFDGLPDGTYEIWYVLGGNRQQIIRVEVRNGKSILQTDELDGGPLFLEEIRDRLRDQLDMSDASDGDASTDPDAAELRMLLGKVESIASDSILTTTVEALEPGEEVESILRAASLPGVGDAALPTVADDEATEDVAPGVEDAEPVGAAVPAAMAAGLGMQRLMRGRRSNPFSASRRTARRLREILERQE